MNIWTIKNTDVCVFLRSDLFSILWFIQKLDTPIVVSLTISAYGNSKSAFARSLISLDLLLYYYLPLNDLLLKRGESFEVFLSSSSNEFFSDPFLSSSDWSVYPNVSPRVFLYGEFLSFYITYGEISFSNWDCMNFDPI